MSVRRAMKRAGMLTLYHFTPPFNLPSILENGIYPCWKEKNDHMLPGATA